MSKEHSSCGERPQYLADIDGLAGVPDSSWVEADGHDGGSPLGLHFATLFDENETIAGSLIDEATGQPIRNDGTVVDEMVGLVQGTIHTQEELDDLYGPDDPESDPHLYYLMMKKAEKNARKLREQSGQKSKKHKS